jgi:hypothetical protein
MGGRKAKSTVASTYAQSFRDTEIFTKSEEDPITLFGYAFMPLVRALANMGGVFKPSCGLPPVLRDEAQKGNAISLFKSRFPKENLIHRWRTFGRALSALAKMCPSPSFHILYANPSPN